MAALCSRLDLIRDARLTLAEVPLADLSFAFRAVPRCDAQWTGDLLALHGEAGTVLCPSVLRSLWAWLPASTKAASARRSPARQTDRAVCECRDVSESRSISNDGRASTTGAS